MKKQPDYNWINDPPAEEDISRNPDGSEFIPIGIIEKKLTRLDPFWGTENFKFQVIEIMGIPLVSGSLELVITYGGRTRRLVGAATLPVDPSLNMLDAYVNANFAATLKSEATKNAVKIIGAAFGQTLNDRTLINQPQKETPKYSLRKPAAVILQADVKMQGQYNTACENINQPLMKSIETVYEGIKYTGTQKLNHHA